MGERVFDSNDNLKTGDGSRFRNRLETAVVGTGLITCCGKLGRTENRQGVVSEEMCMVLLLMKAGREEEEERTKRAGERGVYISNVNYHSNHAVL